MPPLRHAAAPTAPLPHCGADRAVLLSRGRSPPPAAAAQGPPVLHTPHAACADAGEQSRHWQEAQGNRSAAWHRQAKRRAAPFPRVRRAPRSTAGWKGDVPKFQYDLSNIHEAGWKAKHESDESVALTVENVLKMN